MIREALTYLFESATPSARRLGHLSEQIALQARHRRCAAAWAPHLDRMKRAMLAAVVELKPDIVVVLGSGAQLDLPLTDLAAQCRRVVLVDAMHPWSARQAARRFANVNMVTHDLLGLEDGDWQAAPARLGAWRGKVSATPDLVISACVASQLPLAPLRRLPGLTTASEEIQAAWARAVIAAHLDDLKTGPGAALVLTERRRLVEDRAGNTVEDVDPLWGAAAPPPMEGWVWELAPFGEIATDRRTRLMIGAHLWR